MLLAQISSQGTSWLFIDGSLPMPVLNGGELALP